MTRLQVILLAFAISLDSLALSIVDGAMLPKIKQSEILKIALFIGSWQTLSFMIGHNLIPISIYIGIVDYFSVSIFAYRILSFAIFISLGLMMLRKGLKTEYINEERQPFIKQKRMVKIAIFTSIDSFIAGIGLYFTGTLITTEFIPIFIISVLSVIAGIYIGYWFGYEQKPKAYRMGSIIFFVFATNVLII